MSKKIIAIILRIKYCLAVNYPPQIMTGYGLTNLELEYIDEVGIYQ